MAEVGACPEYQVICADVLEWVDRYDGPLFHALLCDPPYHLLTITERFGKPGSAPARYGKDGVFQRVSAGFMNQQWDGGDIAFKPETWRKLGKLLYPGAFGAAYASSRGWHRMAVAIEDGGFIIHPTIFNWCQGQGFPKASRIDVQIERGGGRLESFDSAQVSGLARVWSGHRYGLQALKPAIEPIIVFQKPYDGKPLRNMLETGAGALNIDAARIPWDGSSVGRWPANVVLSHLPECSSAGCAEGCPAPILDEQGGITRRGISQFYFNARWNHEVEERLELATPFMYCPKAGGEERMRGYDGVASHPTLKPIALNRWLASLLLPPARYSPRRLLNPFAGVCSEAIGALLAGWDDIIAVEMIIEYARAGQSRLDYWSERAKLPLFNGMA